MDREGLLAVKASVAMILSLSIFLAEVFLPPTYFLAKPMARLVAAIFSHILPVSAEGTYIVAGSHAVDFVDTCVGAGYVAMVAAFLWLRGFSAPRIAGMTAIVFIANLARIGAVLAILSREGLEAGALAHNLSYALFTLVAMGLIMYATIPIIFTRKGAGRQ